MSLSLTVPTQPRLPKALISEFTTTDTPADWSVTDGKLVYASVSTAQHGFEKAVNIPADQSFVIEMSTANIYRYSNLEIYFNDGLALQLNSNGS